MCLTQFVGGFRWCGLLFDQSIVDDFISKQTGEPKRVDILVEGQKSAQAQLTVTVGPRNLRVRHIIVILVYK